MGRKSLEGISGWKAAGSGMAFAAILASALATAGSALATTPAVSRTDVNLRAGPGTVYPIVVTLRAGAPLAVHGCLADRSWCDVGWRGQRGWVSANFLQVEYQERYVALRPAIVPVAGIGVVAFDEAYWQRHYIRKPWYRPNPRVAHPWPHVWIVR